MADKPFIHPYIPNSVPAVKQAMLDELGLSSVEEIYAEIPDRLRFKGTLDIPPAILSERDLRKHVQGLLDRNTSSVDFLNFCGAGCWQHHVPAVVDEVINRAEFVSAYCGGDYSDLGKYLARFEFNSMLGELLDFDAVANPIYDWGDVAGRSFRMARRITGRDKVLVPAHISPMRLMEIRTLCQPEVMANSTKLRFYEWDRETGMVDLDDLKAKLDDDFAAVYWENPRTSARSRPRAPRSSSSPTSTAPWRSTASTPSRSACSRRPAPSAPTSPAATSSRSACTCTPAAAARASSPSATTTRSSPRSARSSSTPCIETEMPGEYAVGEALADRTSYGSRDQGKDWVGTASGLWTIAAAVYMSLMGPQGFRELGETCIARSHYAAEAARRDPRRADQALAELLQGVRRRLQRHRQDGGRGQQGAARAKASSAARTSRPSSPSSARAPSTASPSTTARPTSSNWPRPSRRCWHDVA